MSDKAAADNTELLESFAEEARRRCDVIAAGLATATTDFETMRAEAHALKGTAGVVGLRRLAELAGLMESDLAEAKKTGIIRGGRRRRRGSTRRGPLPGPALQRLARMADGLGGGSRGAPGFRGPRGCDPHAGPDA